MRFKKAYKAVTDRTLLPEQRAEASEAVKTKEAEIEGWRTKMLRVLFGGQKCRSGNMPNWDDRGTREPMTKGRTWAQVVHSTKVKKMAVRIADDMERVRLVKKYIEG